MPERDHVYDVLVIGAGVSGATAAALLAQAHRDVLLVDAGTFGDRQRRLDWMNPQGKAILEAAAVTTRRLLSNPIRRCVFFSSDFGKSIEPAIPSTPAFIVDCAQLVDATIDSLRAGKHGHFLERADVRQVAPGEDVVTLSLTDGRSVVGKLLLIAAGAGSPLVGQVGLGMAPGSQMAAWSVSYGCPSGDLIEPGRLDYVFGIGGAGGIGYRSSQDGWLTVAACVEGTPSQAIEELKRISAEFQRQALLPANWPEHARQATGTRSPAGLSLVVESHVAKRTLAIGRAGGFIAAYTHEHLYPSMWSAHLASSVVGQALGSQTPQDNLLTFENLWRTELASHIRPPHTDTQSILPLVFSNQQMADRMLESFLLGSNF